jgi:mRNA-degrading endonuclease toxin of MazEF toxin-antitoxin module
MARRPASRQRTPVAERGDIYPVSFDPTEGHEQGGCRPVLVVSPAAFNRLTMVPIVLLITTGVISRVSAALPCR